MNIRDLKYLVALQEHQHFGKAAEACFVSQPALSMQIKKLEEHLGVQLLERTNKSLMFTAVGNVLVTRAQQVLHQVDEMREIARQSVNPFQCELRLGIFPTLAPYLLPHVTPKIAKKFPCLSLLLLEEKSGSLLEKLHQGKIDAAILALPVADNGLVVEHLFDEEFMLAVPANDALAKYKHIKPEMLLDRPLLLLDEGHCLRDQALSFCHRVHAQENLNFRATSLETLRYMVASGVGITLMPKLACQPTASIVYVPFKSPKPTRSIGIISRGTSAKHKVIAELALLMKV
tara:strand:- start:471 stop:1337 length:867 start_codon:yes stop_codon:yes gene_type:complete